MPNTPTPLPVRKTSSAARTRSTESDASRNLIRSREAISRTVARVTPGSAPSYVGGVTKAPSETVNRFRAVVSTTLPFSFNRIASNAPSASASRRATDSAVRPIDLHWLSDPEIRRADVATWRAGSGGISGRLRVVIVAEPFVVARSPAVIVIRRSPSAIPFSSPSFRAPFRRSGSDQGLTIRRVSRLLASRAKCALSRNGAPRWIRIVSKQPSPYAKPRSRIGMRASSSGTTVPSSQAKAVRGHLHAVLREGLRVTAELVERLLVLRLRIGVRDDAAADGEVRRRTNDGRGADRDVPVEGAVPRDVPEGPGVHAAAVGLEALDDLHRARLWRPGDRAAGKSRADEAGDRDVRPEAPTDDALEVVHVREGPQAPQHRNVDAPEVADLPEIVPLEVDDHHVLGGVRLARSEFVREGAVFRGRPASGPRPLDRPCLDVPPADAEEPLRARGQDAVVARVEVPAERRRRPRTQTLVRRLRRAVDREGESM